MQNEATQIPPEFVWTRYGAEGGEEAGAILLRKEQERRAAGGLFLWGIGNSVGPSVRALLEALRVETLPVVFSPMLSKPRSIDVAPSGVVRWTHARGIDGAEWRLPQGSLVTSRLSSSLRTKTRHYALVCRSYEPLRVCTEGTRFSIANLANFASGNRIGHSQVTSVVRRMACSLGGDYVAALVVSLVYPYVLELSEPLLLLPGSGKQAIVASALSAS